MARQTINVGAAANDGTGDTERAAWIKANANFDELYAGRNSLSVVVKTANHAVAAAELGRLFVGDAASGGVIFTLPGGSGLSAGDQLHVRKGDASANRVTLRDGSTDIAWLSAQHDWAAVYWTGAGWVPLRWGIAPLRASFVSSGTSSRPPLATAFDVLAVGGGGGGGSGCSGATATVRTGGGGGAGGAVHALTLPAAAHGAAESVTIGAGGGGGASRTGSGGVTGGTGGTTLLGTLVSAAGGAGGVGGYTAGAAGGAAPSGTFGAAGAGSASIPAGAAAQGAAGITGGGGELS